VKLYRFIYFIYIMLLFFSCKQEEYKEVEPVRITITNLPAVMFSVGTRLYIGLTEDGRYGWQKLARGDGLINSYGIVEISLHYPTGVPWDGQDSSGGNISILKDIKAQERLYKTNVWYDFREGRGSKNITLDFLTDFVPAQ